MGMAHKVVVQVVLGAVLKAVITVMVKTNNWLQEREARVWRMSDSITVKEDQFFISVSPDIFIFKSKMES